MKHIFRFQHRYYPAAVNHSTYGSVSDPYTIVLYGCQCGHHMTKTIKGHWTLDEVKEGLLDAIKNNL